MSRHHAWVRLVAVLVPLDVRADWLREWRGELNARGALDGVAWGALADAWYLRTEGLTMDGVVRDVRLAIRGLLRKPLFTALAGLTLAVGIGANTAIYSVVDGVLLDPLPFPDAHELVSYNMEAPGVGLDLIPQSDGSYLFFASEARTVEAVALLGTANVNFLADGEPRRLEAGQISEGFFDVLGVHPFLGRGFVAGEDRSGAEPVVVLGEGLWRQSFGADPDVVGSMVEMNGVTRRVVGVVEDGLGIISDDVALFIPVTIDDVDPSVGSFGYFGIARLADGFDAAAADQEMDDLLPRLWEGYPDQMDEPTLAQARFAANVVPAKEVFVESIRQALWIVLGTVGFVLLIACANVANLFLVRAESRQREQALRAALGAGRGALIRQYLAESMTLAIGAGLVGLVLAQLGVQALLRLAPLDLPGVLTIEVDGSVLAFTAAVTLGAGLLFGFFPLLGHRRGNLVATLKESGRSSTIGSGRHRLRSALVVGQVAMAMVLLVGSGLMLRSFQALVGVDLGFQSADRLNFAVVLPESSYPGSDEVTAFYRALTEELGALPGVRSVAGISGLPLTDVRSAGNFEGEGSAVPEGDLGPIVERRAITPGYFETMEIRVVEGRPFTWDDGSERGQAVAIVSEALAETYWPGESALGRRVRSTEESPWMDVVGVASDVRFERIQDDPAEMVYLPVAWDAGRSRSLSVVIHGNGEPTDRIAAARDALRRVDKRVPMVDPRPVEQLVREARAATSFTMLLLGVAAAIALLLGAVGIYGVISYVVAGRTQEIGVRMALGAPAESVRREVVARGMVLTAMGLGIGVLGALGLGRVMTSILYGVNPIDPITYLATMSLLAGVAALAAWIPARRASRVDPVEALRAE